MNIMKQAIAMALVMYSFRFLLSKAPVPFVATILVAYLFHQSALLFVVLFPLYAVISSSKQKNRFLRRMLIVAVAIAGVGLIFLTGKTIINYLASTRISYSFMVNHADETTITRSTLIFIVFIVLSHIFHFAKFGEKQSDLDVSTSERFDDTVFFLELLAIIGCLLSELSMVAAGLNRISYYMQYAMLLLIPIYFEIRHNQLVRNIQYLFIGFCILVAFQAASVSAYGAFPYTSQILGISGM
jgi:hypothetical protein